MKSQSPSPGKPRQTLAKQEQFLCDNNSLGENIPSVKAAFSLGADTPKIRAGGEVSREHCTQQRPAVPGCSGGAALGVGGCSKSLFLLNNISAHGGGEGEENVEFSRGKITPKPLQLRIKENVETPFQNSTNVSFALQNAWTGQRHRVSGLNLNLQVI